MVYSRLPLKDPRTIAREIPSIFDVIFPQLTSSVVAYFNKKAVTFPDLKAVSDEFINTSILQKAMLFEVAYARCEQLLNNTDADWDECLRVATRRQQRHFDAKLPEGLRPADMEVAEQVAVNLTAMLNYLHSQSPQYDLTHSPRVAGFQWIASGEGDFSIGEKLIEVKCSGKNFGAADYRQVLMYWLLSYADAIERDEPEWKNIVLLNPRHNRAVEITFNEIIEVTAAGRSKVEILELFSSIIGDYAIKMLPAFRM